MRQLWMMAAIALAGCSGAPPENETAVADTSESAPATTGVTRTEVEPSPSPTPAPLPAAIQTQPGPEGAQVALNRVAVVGDVMTVALSYSGGQCCTYTPVDKVSVIDDATSQRIGVLKDNAGNWMAAPMYSNNKELRVGGSKTAPAQVWFKFPAPPATTKTVSITIPEVAPFDGVPVTR
jgi:hypothetical protein